MRDPIAVLCLAVLIYIFSATHRPALDADQTAAVSRTIPAASPAKAEEEPLPAKKPIAEAAPQTVVAEQVTPAIAPVAVPQAIPASLTVDEADAPSASEPAPSPAPWTDQRTATKFWPVRRETPGALTFAYLKKHPVGPLPQAALSSLGSAEPWAGDENVPATGYVTPPDEIDVGRLRTLSRASLCSTIAAVARANDLPITFVANVIWQESSFAPKTVSRAGALGIAQFMPDAASEQGLLNPFEPVHALFASGKLLRRLTDRFGNLGLAAAAYNAGPQRISDWLAERGRLPGETRAYVSRITGRSAEQWASNEIRHDPEAALMPAMAPCPQVAEEMKAQAGIVSVARLMGELAAATAPAPVAQPSLVSFGEPEALVSEPQKPKATAMLAAAPARVMPSNTRPLRAEAHTARATIHARTTVTVLIPNGSKTVVRKIARAL